MSYREVIFQSQIRQEQILKQLNDKTITNFFFLSIFKEISILLEPIYYKSIFQERKFLELLEKYGNQILKEYDISLDMAPQYIVKILKKDFKFDKRHKRENSITDQVDIEIYPRLQNLIIAKSLLGYYKFYHDEFVESFNYFRWCLKLIYLMKRKNKNCKRRKQTMLFSKVDLFQLNQLNQIINLLCVSCLMEDSLKRLNDWDVYQPMNIKLDENTIYSAILYGILENLIEIFQNSGKNNKPSKLVKLLRLDELSLQYQKCKIYETISEIENIISKHNNKLIEYEINNSEGFKLGVCVNCFEIDYMIKFSILSVLNKYDDDPTKCNCLVKIIQGILLFGNVDIRVLYFFYEIYKYYEKKYKKCQIEMEEYFNNDVTQTITDTTTTATTAISTKNDKMNENNINDNKRVIDETSKSAINETIIKIFEIKNGDLLQKECLELSKHILDEWYNLGQPSNILLPKLILSNINGSIVLIDICYENENRLIKKINYIKLRVQKKINQYDIENSVINNSICSVDNNDEKLKEKRKNFTTKANFSSNKHNTKNKISGYQWVKYWNKCIMDCDNNKKNMDSNNCKIKYNPELNELNKRTMNFFSI